MLGKRCPIFFFCVNYAVTDRDVVWFLLPSPHACTSLQEFLMQTPTFLQAGHKNAWSYRCWMCLMIWIGIYFLLKSGHCVVSLLLSVCVATEILSSVTQLEELGSLLGVSDMAIKYKMHLIWRWWRSFFFFFFCIST